MSATEILTTRNANLADLVALLRAQHAAKLDVVAPARDLTAVGGALRVDGAGEPVLSPDGVTRGHALLRPTALADTGIADKLAIPVAYLRRLREHKIDLYDANVNAWLRDEPGRRFLVRGLADGDGGGVMRAAGTAPAAGSCTWSPAPRRPSPTPTRPTSSSATGSRR
ncbi:hypothetical protein [Pseudonocardia acidicola]|uniref:Uncharacterized protein n=1 Tax=Pseudonocardia acidicola TaxID=2724939 RepID=A0ABX1S4W6_9PSEU|nr:hypothetical protein [Pseudonocardia acidicola]NMH96566.1 hypothetical protein [Pseudonocardia acidicola]